MAQYLRKLNRQLQDVKRALKLKIYRVFYDKKQNNSCDISDFSIENNNIRSILFIRDGKIGDMVVSTLMFREIKKAYPNIDIGVVTKGAAKDIISKNPNVDEIYDTGDSNCLARIKQAKYDLCVEFYEDLPAHEVKFISSCGAKYNMGVNTDDWKLFDLSLTEGIDFDTNDHVSLRYKAFLDKIGINTSIMDMTYDIYMDDSRKDIGEYIVLNPFGASKHRCLNQESIEYIISLLPYHKILLLAHNGARPSFDAQAIESKYPNVIIPDDINNILDSARYIEKASLVISPDTAIVHIAAAFNVNMVALYEYEGGLRGNNHLLWGPDRANAQIVYFPKRKSEYDNFDVNLFDRQAMKEALAKYAGK